MRVYKLSLLFFCEASWSPPWRAWQRFSISSGIRALLDRHQIRSVSSGGMTGNEKRERRVWNKRPWAKRHWRCNSWRDAFKPLGHRGSLKYGCLVVAVSHTCITAVLPILITDRRWLPVATVGRAVPIPSMFSTFYFQKTDRICSGLINCPSPIAYR